MKITRLELLRVPPCWVWLKVHTDEGIVGLGEPFLENHPGAVIAEIERLAPVVVGRDPLRIEELWAAMYDSVFYYKPAAIGLSAISGIDIALWDIAGKAAGLPIHRLLGGACRDRIPLYVGTAPIGHGTAWKAGQFIEPGDSFGVGVRPPSGLRSVDPEVWVETAHAWLAHGFRELKLHFPLGPTLDAMRYVPVVPEIVAAVQAAAGPEVPVSVDLHFPHPKVAEQLLAALEPLRPRFVEDPQQIERLDVLERLAASTSLPIAGSHAWVGKWRYLEALQAGLGVVQPDLLHAGGITECKKIASMAEAFYAAVAPHTPNSIVHLAASLQLAACTPNFLTQEHNQVNDSLVDGQVVIGRGYVREPFALQADGTLLVPDGPGLGIELDDEQLAHIMRKPWQGMRA